MSSVDILFGIEGDKVVMRWQNATNKIEFDFQNAFEFGEQIARTAHIARFGEVPSDEHYLASQIKARVTDQLRDRLIIKAAFDIRSLTEQGKPAHFIATALVDSMLQEVT